MSLFSRRSFLQLTGGALLSAQQQSARKPNFIVLFTDDMGYSDLACYGNPVIRTPNLDRMAEEGIRFTSFYSAAPVCTPSRVGLLTGRYSIRAGQPNNTGPDTQGGLPLSEILLPQVLKKQGYRTKAIGKWHLGFQPVEYMPTSRGFDSWLGLPYSNDMIPPWVKTTRPLRMYRDTEPLREVTDQTRLTEEYTDEAVKFIRDAKAGPFFLYLPYAMPHLPVSASDKFRGKSRGGLYGDVIETIDWSVGEILRTVREQGLDGNTLVIFTSDNGPWHELPPRMLANGVERWHTGTKGIFRGAKGTSYEGGSRVPAIARWPGVIAPRQVNVDMASALDLFPTFVKAAGGQMPADRVYDGYDILPTLRNGARSAGDTFYYVRGAALDAVREGVWKYRYARTENADAVPELFHLENDPAEQYNVYEQNKAIGERLAAKLKAFAAEIGAKT